MGRKIKLVISFEASYEGGDYIPFKENVVEERVELVIPGMDQKFVVLPKVLEGVTDRVISEHNSKVSAYLRHKAEQEREERQMGLFAGAVMTVHRNGVDGTHAQDDDNDVVLPSDEAAEVHEAFAEGAEAGTERAS